jgi:hypothetical protein
MAKAKTMSTAARLEKELEAAEIKARDVCIKYGYDSRQYRAASLEVQDCEQAIQANDQRNDEACNPGR